MVLLGRLTTDRRSVYPVLTWEDRRRRGVTPATLSAASSGQPSRAPACPRRRRRRGGPRARRGAGSRLARDRRALARGADDRDRPRRVEPVGQRVDVVVGRVDASRGCGPRPTRCARARRGPGAPAVAPALVQLGHRHALDARRPGGAPRASSSCRRRGSRRRCVMPTDAGELGRARARPRRRGRRARPAGRGRRARRACEPKPARSTVMQTAPGMCASSNCSSVRTSTTSAPSRCCCSTWRGVSGSARRRPRGQRARG